MIKDRIIQLIENKKLVKEKFFEKIGLTSANFRGKARLTPINSNAIENIFSEIPDLNLEWLLTGKGEMFKSSGKDYTIVQEPETEYNVDYRDKYYKVTEQLKDTLLELNELRKEKDKSPKKAGTGIHK